MLCQLRIPLFIPVYNYTPFWCKCQCFAILKGMNTTIIYALLSVLGISLISWIGLFSIPLHTRFGKKLLHIMVSFSIGALLGDVFLHLLPELAETNQLHVGTSLVILASILGFFVFERLIHWHHHHQENEGDEEEHRTKYHPVVYINLFGDGLHNLIDGLIIGGAYLVSIEAGLATTIAVLLHEIPQEFGDFGILLHGGLPRIKALFYNFLSALTSFIGVIMALIIGEVENFDTLLVAIGIGAFIYIALADLLPEIQKSKSAIWPKLTAILCGIGIMLLLLPLK